MTEGMASAEPQHGARENNVAAGRGGWMSHKALRTTVALAVLSCGVVGSLLAGWQMKRAIEEEAKARFEGVCDEVTTKIGERLKAYAVMLQGGQALFSASQSVTRQEWHTYVQTLDAWEIVPGFLGIGFVLLIKPEELEDHVRKIREEGFSDYDVKPAGPREIYSSIVYIEPFSGRNLRAFGYDMFSEPVRRKAMEHARETGDTALSGKVTLVQENDEDVQAGCLMYVPVYRKGMPTETPEEKRAATFGWVYSAYRMRDLMTGIIPDLPTLGRNLLELRIYDGDEASPEALLFGNAPAQSSAGKPPLLAARRTIDFNGQQWLLVFDGSGAIGAIRYSPAWITALGGLVVSALLFAMMLLAYKRFDAQRTAEDLAEKVRSMAFHDSLTKLPNRLLLRDRMEMALAGCKRSGCHGALMMVDLDNFKPLNDEHGHAAGDLLLVEVAKRLRSCVRETDTVARIGGDEFIVLLASLSGGEAAARREAGAVADKICASLSRPYRLATDIREDACVEHHCSSSIGITLFSAEDASQSKIIKRADSAMYAAKRSGRNCALFDSAQDEFAHGPATVLQRA